MYLVSGRAFTVSVHIQVIMQAAMSVLAHARRTRAHHAIAPHITEVSEISKDVADTRPCEVLAQLCQSQGRAQAS